MVEFERGFEHLALLQGGALGQEHDVETDGWRVTVSPGLISRPPATGRILMTPPSIVMVWIWHCALASLDTQLTRSGAVPLFVIVM